MTRLPLVRRSSPFDLLRSELGLLLGGEPRWFAESQMSGGWFPLDVTETKDDYWVVAEIPGVPGDAVEVSLEENVLAISVRKEAPQLAEGDSIHLRERVFGEFKRSIALPRDVDADKVAAEQRGGLLEIRLPKREETKPRQISITSSE